MYIYIYRVQTLTLTCAPALTHHPPTHPMPSRSRENPSRAWEPLPPVAAMLVAPEKYVAMWAGVALCFMIQTAVVAAQLLSCTRYDEEEGEENATTAVDWSFAGASLSGETADADGGGGGGGVGTGTMTPTAWAACVSVGFLAVTLAFWSTLLAGDGRGAAAAQAAKSAAAVTATEIYGAADGGCQSGMMGWGDPGAIVMCPREDMKVLVEGVEAATGPPEQRKLCQTCLVRKPLRSKVRCCRCRYGCC